VQQDDDRRTPPQRPAGGRGAARPDYGQTGRLAGSQNRPAGGERAGKPTGAGRRVAGASGRAAGAAVRAARRASHASGAGETGLARLIELHAFNAAGDAALAVSLAGTLFFTVPSGEARGQIALFLAVTMLPFAVVAPLIGPFLDRFRRGRRWAIGSTMAVRAFGCWALATAVATDSIWLFPAALTCLVASKAYGVTRASAVPRLLPEGITLVKANSRISLAGIAGVTISGPLAGATSLIGPEWSLRYAALIFAVATVLAIKLPPRVDSSEGEEQIGMRELTESGRGGRVGVSSVVVMALRCNAGLRVLSGFLTIYMAFLLREEPLSGWEDRRTLLLGLVLGCVGLGSTLGTVTGNLLRDRKPEVIVLVVLVADAVAIVYAGVFYALIPAMVLGLTAGMSQQLGKLSLDALIQREVPERVRTSVFARSETLLQMSWVIGGFLGVFMPYIPRLSLLIVAALLVGWLMVILRGRALARRTARAY
jgi:MFS family permease